MDGLHPARATPALRSTLLLVAFAGLSGCRQTPAPEHATAYPAPAPTAGQVVPVTPEPVPPPPPPPAPEQTPAAVAAPASASPVKPLPRKAMTPKPAAASASAPPAPKPVTAVPATNATAAAPQAGPKPAAPSLDLDALEQRLRDTKAIGVFTKLSLKNQVDDLLDTVRQYHRNPANPPQPVVRRQFEGLILKVLSSLQDGDPQLANTIAASREALWGILMDPDKFSKI